MADFDIRVNCVGSRTDQDRTLLKGVSDEQIEAIVSHQVMPKIFQPGDVCDLCEFLLSPRIQVSERTGPACGGSLVSLIEKLTQKWENSDDPFLIHPSGELSFDEVSSQEAIDLSEVKSGDVVALIGDFDPASILTLLRLIDIGSDPGPADLWKPRKIMNIFSNPPWSM
jgi:hypothetical protein